MRRKTCARVRPSKSSNRSSLITTARPLPSPISDNISNNSTESGGNASADSSEVEATVKTCLKCNGGEQLLVCSGCPVAVHAKCLGSEPKCVKEGKFYCPYCWYKLLKAKAKASFKKAMSAKKDLEIFLSVKPLVCSNRDKQDDARAKGNDPDVGQNLGENKQCEHASSMDVDDKVPNGTGEVEKEHQIDSNLKLPHQSRAVAEGERISETLACETLEDERGTGKQKDDQQVTDEKDEGVNSIDVNMEKENDDHQVMDKKVEGIDAEEVCMKEQKDNQPREPEGPAKKSPLKKPMQSRVPANKHTKLSFAHDKRKRLHWKPEEEKALREGVEIFAAKVKKNIPWRKILELGGHVFDSSRTPADLKDKWRNIVGRESSTANRMSS